jgi:hypothetical protein
MNGEKPLSTWGRGIAQEQAAMSVGKGEDKTRAIVVHQPYLGRHSLKKLILYSTLKQFIK